MLHYRHGFGIDKDNNLVLNDSYLYINYCLPSIELKKFRKEILGKLGEKWDKGEFNLEDGYRCENYSFGDLCLSVNIYNKHPEDAKARRKFPDSYCSIDLVFFTKNFVIEHDLKIKPWHILKTGFRKKDKRHECEMNHPLPAIANLLPAQVELGCGPSIEAGVPPLNYLHKVYSVIDEKKKYIFSPLNDSLLLELLDYPQNAFANMTQMFGKCFLAKPTKFYRILKKLSEKKLVVGDIITNNFDGLIRKIGLSEKYVRRYESEHIIPNIAFHPDAKSLIVVGSHADRRKIHHAARSRGLVVIHVDPEGYMKNDVFESYPIEDVLADDILFKEPATKAFTKLYKYLKKIKL